MQQFFRRFGVQFGSGGSGRGGGNLDGVGRTVALGIVGVVGAAALYDSLFTVQGGHRAVMFNRFVGVKDTTYGEGTHFMFPWFERPTVFDIRTKPTTIRSPSGTKDLQMVDITLRVLFRPDGDMLPRVYAQLGTNYADRVLPSIINETLKSVIAQFNASQLITQREQVSFLIRRSLTDRAKQFNILIDDVAITHLTFSPEYTAAVEAKQIAQQEAERAKYLVKQAIQDKKSTIIKAEAEATSAQLIGDAVKDNPAFIELRQLEAAKEIATLMSKSNTQIYLDSNTLLLNPLQLTGPSSAAPAQR